jgi:hypothetical protein
MPSNLHNSLKNALKLTDSTIIEFARTRTRPNGKLGVSHSFVIAVAKGDQKTPWLRKEIKKFIAASRFKYPEYWSMKKCSTEILNV